MKVRVAHRAGVRMMVRVRARVDYLFIWISALFSSSTCSMVGALMMKSKA